VSEKLSHDDLFLLVELQSHLLLDFCLWNLGLRFPSDSVLGIEKGVNELGKDYCNKLMLLLFSKKNKNPRAINKVKR
jgi:hypothetical protein